MNAILEHIKGAKTHSIGLGVLAYCGLCAAGSLEFNAVIGTAALAAMLMTLRAGVASAANGTKPPPGG